MSTRYYTATTLDGYIADDHDSLDWLFEQQVTGDGPGGYEPFIARVGAIVMGTTTYTWVVDHLRREGEAWPYPMPAWVFTHQRLEAVEGGDVRFVQGDVAARHAEVTASAGDLDVWVVGGGDLAGQYADAGLLDSVEVSIAPVTLGSGRPLFPRRHDLRLESVDRNGDFVVASYAVRGPR